MTDRRWMCLEPEDQWKWSFGTRVRKKSGSSWQGIVVGFYHSTTTPEGYCVESEREPGSVRNYPVSALEKITDAPR